jgi:glycine cleavage system aminomethyltransferase T
VPAPRSAVHAIRESVAWTRLDRVRYLRFTGARARDAVDALCAATLRVRDGQLQHVVLLTDDARCFADAYVLCDDDAYDLLVEGPDAAALDAHIRTHVPPDPGVSVEDRSASHIVLSVDGPYAWELVSRVAGAESIGLPYLTFFHGGGWTCYRAGRTGEFGYGIIVERAGVAELEGRLASEGARLDLQQGDTDALDQCALENLFFNIHREGRAVATPLELQLQWRVSYDKRAVGLDALRARRAAGARERLTSLVSASVINVGDTVSLGGQRVGTIANAGWSETRGDCVALALLDRKWAHPGIDAFTIASAGREVAARSLTGPLLNNRSLFVSPQLHSYATRHEVPLPPLVRS